MTSYEVDPDALFSDEEEPSPAPSPKRARIALPPAPAPLRAPTSLRAPAPPSLGALKLPSFGTASLSGRSTAPSINPPPSISNNPYGRLQSSYSRPNNPYSDPRRPQYSQENSYRSSTASRSSAASYNRPAAAAQPYTAPPHPVNDPHRGPMGRGRAATLPAHVTRNRHPPPPSVSTSITDNITAMASILPESDRERFIQEKLREHKAAASAGRKRPTRRRRPDDQSAQKVLANLKNSRKGTFKGLNSLLQAAQNSGNNLIQLEGSKHRVRRPETAHAVYAEATMTKEMIEREEREKWARQREIEEEQESVHRHFREMRQREKEERQGMSKKWLRVETVAAGMRHAYRLARVERSLFGEEEDAKRRTLENWGLTLLPVEEDEKVTELMTIHVEEI